LSKHPQPEPVVENLLIVETVESQEHPQPEPVVETVESQEHPQPEPVVENLLIVETVESQERSQPEPEPILDTPKSLEHPQPEAQPVVKNRHLKKSRNRVAILNHNSHLLPKSDK
jgi:ribosome-dependent ATPase